MADGAIEAAVRSLAKLLDRAAPFWCHTDSPAMAMHRAAILVRTQGDAAPALLRLCVGMLPMPDPSTATRILRAWAAVRDRRRAHGTPIADLGVDQDTIDAHEAKPTSHVRVQMDEDGPDAGVWFVCQHCTVRRFTRAVTADDLRRDGHDFQLRHGHCVAPKTTMQ